jgi:hypothetical protein
MGVVLLRPGGSEGHAAGSVPRGRDVAFLYGKGIRIFDYAQVAEPLRVRSEHGHRSWLPQRRSRSSKSVRSTFARRTSWQSCSSGGNHPGPVHVISAMEACQSYKPWDDLSRQLRYVGVIKGVTGTYCCYLTRLVPALAAST